MADFLTTRWTYQVVMHFGATGMFDVLEVYEHGLHKQTQYSDHIEQSQSIG